MLKFLKNELNDLSKKNTILISIILVVSSILTTFSIFAIIKGNVELFNIGLDMLKISTAILLYGYSICILLNIVEKRQRN